MARGERLPFLDVLRGLAIVLMVLNHTARWWLGHAMEPSRSALIYATVLLPGATFLFLVGFCLPLAEDRRAVDASFLARAPRWLRRALEILLAGLVLNVVVFPEDPPWSGRVLYTIGVAVLALGPLVPAARSRPGRGVLAALAIVLCVVFVAAARSLPGWIAEHPLVAQMLFREFPPWPWLAIPTVGLVLGSSWLDRRRRDPRAERRFFAIAGAAGLAGVVAYLALDAWLDPRPRLGFERDLLLNDCWTPWGSTVLLVVGGVALLLVCARWVGRTPGVARASLAILGRAALMLYVFHQVIVVTLVSRALGWRADGWATYALANAALIASLVGVGLAWLAVKGRVRARTERSRKPAVAIRRAA